MPEEQVNIFKRVAGPIIHRFQIKDMLQVIIGATILSIPVAYTGEVWQLAETLPMRNILGFLGLSLVFISLFVYHHYHREETEMRWGEFAKRVLSTYILSFLVVALILTMIERAPWGADWLLAVKRTILVAFPASMSAVVADVLK
ncbi:MAG: DUF2391 family protein [bacterium]|nr:DUF2391 family protein [bacterium]